MCFFFGLSKRYLSVCLGLSRRREDLNIILPRTSNLEHWKKCASYMAVFCARLRRHTNDSSVMWRYTKKRSPAWQAVPFSKVDLLSGVKRFLLPFASPAIYFWSCHHNPQQDAYAPHWSWEENSSSKYASMCFHTPVKKLSPPPKKLNLWFAPSITLIHLPTLKMICVKSTRHQSLPQTEAVLSLSLGDLI